MDDSTRASNPPQWQTTHLWGSLEMKSTTEADAVRTTLKQCMPKIEAVLNKGGTAPSDFTLHDADHSYRVAQRMADVVPTNVLPELSAYELGLLLLSAYLHDIGMTPERRKVREHYDFLLTGEKGDLRETEIAELQEWLDDQNREVTIPLCTSKPEAETLNLAVELDDLLLPSPA